MVCLLQDIQRLGLTKFAKGHLETPFGRMLSLLKSNDPCVKQPCKWNKEKWRRLEELVARRGADITPDEASALYIELNHAS